MASIAPQAAPAVTPERIIATALGFWPAQALLTAVELGVFTELAGGPLALEDLRARLGLHERAARDCFDTLVALGMLQREDGRYSNAPDTDLFLDRRKPTYTGGLLQMASHRLYPSWGKLAQGLRTGQPQSEVESATFEELYGDPARLREFLSAMTGITSGTARVMARQFPWHDYRTFCDIGPAQGALPVQVALAHPHLAGIGFDLPQVQPVFDEYVASFGLQDRLRFEAGDFFRDALPHADVLTMSHILHDWGLSDKRMLIRKAYEALPEGGALIVMEAIIDDERRHNAFGLMMSLNMLVETREGFDYTGADCSGWMREAGFRDTRVEHLAGPDSMVIGVK